MKKIKKSNHIGVLLIVASTLMFIVSCKKEILDEPTLSDEAVNLSDAQKSISNKFAFSPWHIRYSGVAPQTGIVEMSEPDPLTSYGVTYDNLGITPLHDITITHNGGVTWHSQTIDGLEDNSIFDVAATRKAVHVFGLNYIKGGGNFFRSTNRGMTWQREAANAFTDPASFPDVIEFFNPRDGVIFGDPLGGYYEIYTTGNGGNTWSRVPSNKIPPPLVNEYGIPYHSDTYLNTIWMLVSTLDENFNPVSSRLLQSDDRGINWYVRNPYMTSSGYDGTIKFRNRYVGLYKNNGILYRTTDRGTTWKEVNYSGTWFSFDFDNLPGLPGWWISTGGGTPGNALSLYGFGSSISYDDGNHWIILDTLNHTCVDMTSPFHGYSGGITSGSGNDGVYVYSWLPSRLSSLKAAGNVSTDKMKVKIPNPSANVFVPGDKSAILRQRKNR